MNVRFDGHYYICECGSAMMYLDGMDVQRRRICCSRQGCQFYGSIFLEPVFRLELAAP